MRIRTDGDYAHRKDTIERAAQFWGCNKTRALLLSAEVAGDVVPALERALEHEDLPPNVAQELVDKLNQSSRHLDIEYERPLVSIKADD